MGDYTAPPAPATCETVDAAVTVEVSTDVPVAYERDLDTNVCLDVDLSDAREKLVELNADASLE